jgi:hypothetical protein
VARHAALGFALVLPQILVGCLGAVPLGGPDAVLADVSIPIVESGNLTASGKDPLVWMGRDLASRSSGDWSPACRVTDCEPPPPECGKENCETRPFNLSFPDGYWERNAGSVQVVARWPYNTSQWFILDVLDSSGKVVARGRAGWFASLAEIEKPASGEYTARVMAAWGKGSYDGAIQIQARAADEPVRELLPNLVTLTPLDLRIQSPDFIPFVPGGAAVGSATRGCGPDEMVEGRARAAASASRTSSATPVTGRSR